jgi:hypothetical protein
MFQMNLLNPLFFWQFLVYVGQIPPVNAFACREFIFCIKPL